MDQNGLQIRSAQTTSSERQNSLNKLYSDRIQEIGVAPLPPAITFGKAASARSYNWYQKPRSRVRFPLIARSAIIGRGIVEVLSVISRGSWDDVARRFTMVQWGPNRYFGLGGPKNYLHIIMFSFVNRGDRSDLIVDQDYDESTTMYLKPMFPGPGPDLGPLTCSPPITLAPLLMSSSPVVAVVAHRHCRCRNSFRPYRCDDSVREIFAGFLVQTTDGIEISVMDWIGQLELSTVEVLLLRKTGIVGARHIVTNDAIYTPEQKTKKKKTLGLSEVACVHIMLSDEKRKITCAPADVVIIS
ncbi:pentatricopeptide repeat-containing protein [Dorcoceras hygrometricum]|uniref:Pentatricopeptide repeat-containing protein n=1 Tax=Dorcoceras hygrometricum TaxID=472368 RepID=A0A2Z7BVR5_9LAMI|nr:pentatricopeptide repeat-containing protein [Dorcoceras hygrometricum]